MAVANQLGNIAPFRAKFSIVRTAPCSADAFDEIRLKRRLRNRLWFVVLYTLQQSLNTRHQLTDTFCLGNHGVKIKS